MEESTQDNPKDKRFELLKELLLEDDREKFNELSEEIVMREKVASRIDPIIDEKIQNLKRNFPEYFGDTITETIKIQVRDSQDEVIDALYPIIGKLIKKAIVTEIQKLSNSINEKVKNTFSFKDFFKRKISGVSDGEAALQDAFKPALEEIFIIEKDSGILLGNHSTGNIANKDMISGMLTAIKSFAEDAFSKEGQDLEDIKFETFEISLYNFNTLYIALAISGIQTPEFKEDLDDNINNFAEFILGDRSHLENEIELNKLIVEYLINE